MRSFHSKLRMLLARITNDGLEYLAFIERADDGGDHVHQLKLLPGNILWKEGTRIRRQFEETAVK